MGMHDRIYGFVSYDDDMVTLLPQFPKTFNGFQSFPEPFVPLGVVRPTLPDYATRDGTIL